MEQVVKDWAKYQRISKKLDKELVLPHEWTYLYTGLWITLLSPILIWAGIEWCLVGGVINAEVDGSWWILFPTLMWALVFMLLISVPFGTYMARHVMNELGWAIFLPMCWWYIGPLMVFRFTETVRIRKLTSNYKLFKDEPMRPLSFDNASEMFFDKGRKAHLLHLDILKIYNKEVSNGS